MRDDLPELNKAGVASIKLEGRLKRPEYVATIANSYRNAIDAMDNGHFRKADEAEMTGLRQIFSRGGFMRGYAMGAEDVGAKPCHSRDSGGYDGCRISRKAA